MHVKLEIPGSSLHVSRRIEPVVDKVLCRRAVQPCQLQTLGVYRLLLKSECKLYFRSKTNFYISTNQRVWAGNVQFAVCIVSQCVEPSRALRLLDGAARLGQQRRKRVLESRGITEKLAL